MLKVLKAWQGLCTTLMDLPIYYILVCKRTDFVLKANESNGRIHNTDELSMLNISSNGKPRQSFESDDSSDQLNWFRLSFRT